MQLYLFDRSGAQVGAVADVLSAKRTVALDGTDELDLVCVSEIEKDYRVVGVEGDGTAREWVACSPSTSRAGSVPVQSVHCVSAMRDLESHFIVEMRNRGISAPAAMAKALEGTGWELDSSAVSSDAKLDTSFYHVSSWEAVTTVLDAYSIEAEPVYAHSGGRITKRTLRIAPYLGSRETAHRFEYGRDLVDVKRTFAGESPKTRLYAYGKGVQQTGSDGEATGGYSRKIDFSSVNGGKPYIEDASMEALWGVRNADGTTSPSSAMVEYSDCEDPAELLALAKKAFEAQRQPKVSYEATVAALEAAGEGFGGAALGDAVQIVDTTFSPALRLSGRVQRMEVDLLGGAPTKLAVGDIVQTRRQRNDAVQKMVDRLTSSSGAWNDAATLNEAYLEGVVNGLNTVLNATGGYTYLTKDAGIWIYSKPKEEAERDPKAWVLQLSGGYWRIANTKKADGSWNFTNMATANGIVAANLVAGTITGGDNYWNLATGEFRLAPSVTVGGKTVQQYADKAESDANGYTDAVKQAAITEAKRQADAADATNLAAAKADATAKANNALAAAKAQSKSDSDAAKTAAQSYVDALSESLGQESIFNRLTNNGKTKGFVLTNGELYINATYIKSGVLNASLIKAGIITDAKGLNYWDMTTGEFRLAATSTVGGKTVDDIASVRANGALASANSYTDASARAANKYTDSAKQAAIDAAKKASDAADATNLAAAKADAQQKADAALSAAKAQSKSDSDAAKTAAQSYVDALDESLGQASVFNRLTDYGKAQGFTLTGGQLYVNATYIKTGVLSAGLIKAGIISDATGRNSWDMTTGALTTSYMTANHITANGTFKSGSTYGIELNSSGQLAGFYNGTKVGYIDYSAVTTDIPTGATLCGIQIQTQGSLRISSPKMSTAATSDTSTTTIYGLTKDYTLTYTREIHNNGDGTIGWTNSTRIINFINGLCTVCTFN